MFSLTSIVDFLIGFFVGQNTPAFALPPFVQQVVDFFAGLFGGGGMLA